MTNGISHCIFVTSIINPKDMKTSDFTALSSYNDIHSKRLKTIIMKEEKEYIEKQEILDAIRDGLLEIKEARSSGRKLMTAEELLNEL